MKIAVLGAGVIGVTTAHYLAKAGHEVTVIDRQSGPALETSFANAGELSPGYSSPWAATAPARRCRGGPPPPLPGFQASSPGYPSTRAIRPWRWMFKTPIRLRC